MTSEINHNSIVPFFGAERKDLQEAAGITQFLPSGTEWYHSFEGLLIQGGLTASLAGNALSASIPFNVGFPKQVLGVFITPKGTAVAGTGIKYSAAVSIVDLGNFKIANDSGTASQFYWWAIGL